MLNCHLACCVAVVTVLGATFHNPALLSRPSENTFVLHLKQPRCECNFDGLTYICRSTNVQLSVILSKHNSTTKAKEGEVMRNFPDVLVHILVIIPKRRRHGTAVSQCRQIRLLPETHHKGARSALVDAFGVLRTGKCHSRIPYEKRWLVPLQQGSRDSGVAFA